MSFTFSIKLLSKRLLVLFFFVFIPIAIFPISKEEESSFSLDWGIDGIFLGSAALIWGVDYILQSGIIPSFDHIEQPSSFNLNDINVFDRWTARPLNLVSSKWSDILQISLLFLPSMFIFYRSIEDIGILAVMFAETILLSQGLVRLTKRCVTRYRPYTYYENNADTIYPTDSFYSGHTTMAFTSAAFFTTVFSGYHPDSVWKYVVGTISFGLASTVGVLRITAGKHFLSDVLVGAAIGSLIGWFVPFMHKNRNKDFPAISLYSGENQKFGISCSFNF